MPARFRGLTRAQEAAFERIACHMAPAGAPRTLKALVDAGLIDEYEECAGVDACGAIMVTSYDVPLPVHMEWCAWCSEHLDGQPPSPESSDG